LVQEEHFGMIVSQLTKEYLRYDYFIRLLTDTVDTARMDIRNRAVDAKNLFESTLRDAPAEQVCLDNMIFSSCSEKNTEYFSLLLHVHDLSSSEHALHKTYVLPEIFCYTCVRVSVEHPVRISAQTGRLFGRPAQRMGGGMGILHAEVQDARR
jgi:hypothetical protein